MDTGFSEKEVFPRVSVIMRKPGAGHFSIERVFDVVHRQVRKRMVASKTPAPRESRGVCNRIKNIRWARGLDADVYHVTGDIHYISFGLWKRKSILTIHDCAALHRLRGWRRSLLFQFWYRWPVRLSCAVTTISRFSAMELSLLGIVAKAGTRVIYDPVPPEFTFFPRMFNALRPRLLHLGTKPNKNLERVARALRGIDCHLTVVGRPTQRQLNLLSSSNVEYAVEERVSDSELVELYRNCDLVLFASTYEGFGMPIVEAQATGRPVVTSCVASMPEVAGNGACFVNPFEVDSIRSGILRVIEDSAYREYLIAEGLKNVKRFQADIIARQYEDLYREVYASGPGPALGSNRSA